MQRLLQDTGIMKKMLALMLMLGGMVIVTAAVNSWTVRSVSERYDVLVQSKMPSITQLVRGLRLSTDMVRSSYAALTSGPGSKEAERATNDMKAGFDGALHSFDKAAELNPEMREWVAVYRATIREVQSGLEKALWLSRASQNDRAALGSGPNCLAPFARWPRRERSARCRCRRSCPP